MYYSIYGLRVHSNLPVPGLLSGPVPSAIDVRVWLQAAPPWSPRLSSEEARLRYVSDSFDERNEPVLKVWKINEGRWHLMRYGDGIEFVINQSSAEIWVTWPSVMTPEDTATYLLGPVFGFLLRLRGVTCLHASAVVIGDRAIALLGYAGAGKSTAAAVFAQKGYPVLSEDVVALCEQGNAFLAQPGYPLIRLWPESVQALCGAADALPSLTPNWDKRYLSLTGNEYRFQREPAPLGAVYILSERAEDPKAPFIEPVSPQDGAITLVANTYTNYLLDQTMRAREFETLGRLVNHVPLRRITPHSDIRRLPDLCQVILDDFDNLNQSK